MSQRPYETERDACGIGFVADARGRTSRTIVDAALDALCRVKHRGAVAADALTGDGAGVLLPIAPDVVAPDGDAQDRLGVAMCFLRTEPERARAMIEQACRSEAF